MNVEIVEVGPRDGLQNHPAELTTGQKAELVRRAVAAGSRRVEVTSFVNPAKVPKLADADALTALVRDEPGLASIGLVMNGRGLDRAVAAGVTEVNFVVVATDTFCRRNQGTSTAEAVAEVRRLLPRAREQGLRTSVTVGAAFGCPFEGETPPERVLRVVDDLAPVAPDEVALADTIGVAVPSQVERLFTAVRGRTGASLRGHFHNTRNLGLANVLAAVGSGARAIDASVGGIGGCPFAPAATGNVATEDVVYALERSGTPTGVSLDAAIGNARWLGEVFGAELPGMLSRAGGFP
ncbi:hydroxymethylglutaryl-CoA lyase [Micromonospora tulbaghiae]|uniref:Hydroxymethylglutaryl-CoA lyase n=1 Tax=Micromonospora tulbaghiae TaxID=479978 RepID=A0AAW4JAS6_9ACTN|nr:MULTISPECIES: hydroxymethylglutaryl-CoA lyase [Micromonospora]KAB1910195.1 hydroxymethylglutaryl-CoA lyase [Micromonospora sp. AMSO1212t]MBO4138639.1 hydroxymethylglutaryl-CoA lyase [Micromonospora tulbaghiae]